MAVFRLNPLPIAKNTGSLYVAESVAVSTRHLLQQSKGSDGRHEGIVIWLGRRAGNDAFVLNAYRPRSEHGPQSVWVTENEIGPLNRYARSMGMTLVAQVHSHPGTDTHHSDGDDRMILLPHEGMFSLVVAEYGDGSLLQAEGSGLHQYQQNQWVYIPPKYAALKIVPTMEAKE